MMNKVLALLMAHNIEAHLVYTPGLLKFAQPLPLSKKPLKFGLTSVTSVLFVGDVHFNIKDVLRRGYRSSD